MTERTPWRRLLAAAALLGIEPAQFWRLSLREWRALTGTHGEAMTRTVFDELTRLFPDENHARQDQDIRFRQLSR